jgi:hypothetical protein
VQKVVDRGAKPQQVERGLVPHEIERFAVPQPLKFVFEVWVWTGILLAKL